MDPDPLVSDQHPIFGLWTLQPLCAILLQPSEAPSNSQNLKTENHLYRSMDPVQLPFSPSQVTHLASLLPSLSISSGKAPTHQPATPPLPLPTSCSSVLRRRGDKASHSFRDRTSRRLSASAAVFWLSLRRRVCISIKDRREVRFTGL